MKTNLLCAVLCCSVLLLAYGQAAGNAVRAPVSPSTPAPGAPATLAPPTAAQPRVVSPAELFTLVSEEAKNGNGQAMLNMGIFYERGIGVAINFGQALEWYKKAADADVPEGLYNVGVCYEIGMGTAPDQAAAISWFERAAKVLPQGAYKLALIYLAQSGDASIEKGIALLSQASDEGHPAAGNDLGAILLQGLFGRKKDEKRALVLFTKAADAGSLEAAKNLGVVFKDGLGQKADPVKALMWYTIARLGGYPPEAVDPVLAGLKEQLKPEQVTRAEADAKAWIAAYQKKLGG